MNTTQIPPNAVATERAILGALLLDVRAISRAHTLGLEAHHFYEGSHRKIYTAITSLHFDEGEVVDQLTLGNYLQRLGQLDEVGGVVYLADLAAEVATAANVQYHAGIVLEKAALRELIEEAYATLQRAYAESETSQKIAEDLHQRTTRRAVGHTQEGWSTPADELIKIDEAYQHAKEKGLEWAGLDCGFGGVNDMMSGLCPGEITIVGARPNIGKSTIGLQVSTTIAESGTHVAILSIEMTKQQLMQRLVCIEAEIDVRRLRSGRLSGADFERYQDARRRLQPLPIHLDYTPALTATKATAKLEQLMQDYPVGLVVIDYLQLMDGPGDSKNQVLETASMALQNLAKTLELHFLVLSQLSRGVEMREDRRPRMSDLRDSGGIEQNADNVLLIHRPGKYEDIVEKWTDDSLNIRTWVEIVHDKTRFGPTGPVELVWVPETAQFANPVRVEFPQSQYAQETLL